MTFERPKDSFEHPVTPPGKIVRPAIREFIAAGANSAVLKEDFRLNDEAESPRARTTSGRRIEGFPDTGQRRFASFATVAGLRDANEFSASQRTILDEAENLEKLAEQAALDRLGLK